MDLRELPTDDIQRHPWERARARFFCRVVSEHAPRTGALRVLDIGAGDGFVGAALVRELPAGSRVTCYDPNYTSDHLLRFAAACGTVSFTATRPRERFDVIVLLDVIEHVQDDVGLLREVASELLVPDGVVIVSVPAHMALYSRHDVVLGHFRRYDARGLRATLERAGLRPTQLSGLFHSLVGPRGAAKVVELARGERSVPPPPAPPDEHADTAVARWDHGALLTRFVDGALALDNLGSRLLARAGLRLPGTSLWAVAHGSARP
jgi:SAM-dependent methyltransferase